MKTTVWILLGAAVMAGLITTPATADSGCGNRADLVRGPRLTLLGLTAVQRLVRFRECNPGRLVEIGSVSGLKAPGDALVGIDFRVQDGQLYGVGGRGGIYTLARVFKTHSKEGAEFWHPSVLGKSLREKP